MNKFRTSDRFCRLLAFLLSGFFYTAVIALFLLGIKNSPKRPSVPVIAPVRLNISQIALKAVESSPPAQSPPEPVPVPDRQEQEQEPLLPRPEKQNVPAEPEAASPATPQESVQAQVAQEAFTEVSVPTRDILLAWVREQIEKEKYYPAAARNAGYEGRFRLLVKVRADGVIAEAVVLDGRGHPILRRSLERIMAGLAGRSSGLVPDAPVELPFDFEFKLTGTGR